MPGPVVLRARSALASGRSASSRRAQGLDLGLQSRRQRPATLVRAENEGRGDKADEWLASKGGSADGSWDKADEWLAAKQDGGSAIAVVEEEADREVRSGRGPGVDFFSGWWETHRREPAYLAQGTNEHERNSIRKTRGGKRV